VPLQTDVWRISTRSQAERVRWRALARGKAALFKRFTGVDAVPLCLACTDVGELVEMVAALAPSFGGINLEDISAPRCFEVEDRLRERLDIPVFHDDQHGIATQARAEGVARL
jgi:malate dehydrogenase (oxaloacetate-decarboxylating)